MLKTKEQIQDENIDFIYDLKELEVSEGCHAYKDAGKKVYDLIHKIRQDDLDEIMHIIKDEASFYDY